MCWLVCVGLWVCVSFLVAANRQPPLVAIFCHVPRAHALPSCEGSPVTPTPREELAAQRSSAGPQRASGAQTHSLGMSVRSEATSYPPCLRPNRSLHVSLAAGNPHVSNRYVLQVLRTLHDAMLRTGIIMRVDLHALDSVAATLQGKIPAGLPYAIASYSDVALRAGANDYHLRTGKYKYEVTGKWRKVVAAEVAMGSFDFYFIIEDDVLFAVDQLQALCEESERLEGAHLKVGSGSQDDNLVRLRPSLFRYELAHDRNNQKFLTDYHRPHVSRLITNVTLIREAAYIVPSTPYSSHVFLTRASMEYAVSSYDALVPGWTSRPWYEWALRDDSRARQYNLTRFRLVPAPHRAPYVTTEVYSGLWLMKLFQMVYPSSLRLSLSASWRTTYLISMATRPIVVRWEP